MRISGCQWIEMEVKFMMVDHEIEFYFHLKHEILTKISSLTSKIGPRGPIFDDGWA